MVRSLQTVNLSCEITYDTPHLGVQSGASKLIFEHMVRSIQTVHVSDIKISTISKQIELCFDLSLIT